jgi:4-hydroxybenzoate polyprenyltransferase
MSDADASTSDRPGPAGSGRGLFPAVRRWGEMVKFSHSIFALPFALIATFLAARAAYRSGDASRPFPTGLQLLLVVCCMVTARSAAMTFNRIVDATIDARNPRTAGRALPLGTMSQAQAGMFFFASAALFLLSCLAFWSLYDNRWPLALALPVLTYLCFYSYTKRFTRWSHFVLGSAIALSPAAAWLAIHPVSIGWAAVVLVAAVAFWIAGFDIIYACQDIEIDRREGLHSLPSRVGPARALLIARASHVGTVILLIALLPIADLRYFYAVGVGIVATLLYIENALVAPTDFSRVNLAFFTINGVISLLLAALAITDIVSRP